jgi:4-hydroxy-3-polyprenylbenzoate decarboxylase
VFALTGASGSIYAYRTAKAILEAGYRLELILSPAAEIVVREELELRRGKSFSEFLLSRLKVDPGEGSVIEYRHNDIGAAVASGSHRIKGMVVIPCTMKTLAGIAHGLAGNLIERAADVALKERRPLILVTRESPMNLIQLRNQVAAAEAGASIVPASPAFYHKPKSLDELADFIAGRVLSLLGIDLELVPPWTGSGR